MSITIHPQTRMGAVHLTVADLGRSLAYYRDGIGLTLQRQAENTAVLGAGTTDLLFLTEQPGARPARGYAGLYHFALLVPSRRELARTLQHLIDSQTAVDGASDHSVSEALYLTDPDGHGIEIYRDRPREEWEYIDGTMRIDTRPLDIHGVMGELAGGAPAWTGLHPQTRMGHVHLHVSRLADAITFYTEILGFDFIAGYGRSAGFVSAGGYHHHLGLNTWAGEGAPPPPADTARLLWYQIVLPAKDALDESVRHIQAAGYEVEPREDGFSMRDPAGNGIILTAKTNS